MVKNEWKRKYFYKDQSSFYLSDFIRPDLNHEAMKQLISIGYSIEPECIINNVAKINYQEAEPVAGRWRQSDFGGRGRDQGRQDRVSAAGEIELRCGR